MNSYKMGLVADVSLRRSPWIGTESVRMSAGTAIMATAGIGAVILLLARKPRSYRSAGDMRDIEAKIRAKGGDPYKYGW